VKSEASLASLELKREATYVLGTSTLVRQRKFLAHAREKAYPLNTSSILAALTTCLTRVGA
jgi:hypothetical protein